MGFTMTKREMQLVQVRPRSAEVVWGTGLWWVGVIMNNHDDWNIRKMSNEELIKLLQNPLTCEDVDKIAIKETLARILNILIQK
jgi:hypothetical protein